jgi:hypothetical protein
MYKHVAKFTKELREFSYEGLDVNGAVDKRFRKEDEALLKAIESKNEDREFFCSLCKKWVNNHPNSARDHANSRGHTKRLRKFKMVYRGFMKGARENVLKQSRPKNKFWRRLMYYRLIHNFQTEI